MTKQIEIADKEGLCLVYFSSIAAQLGNTPYLNHKRQMEHGVKRLFNNYFILRIGNIEGDTNPNTFLNYIRAKQAKGEPVEIRDEYRYMISKEQLLLITDNLPWTGKNEISIFGTMKKVKDLI